MTLQSRGSCSTARRSLIGSCSTVACTLRSRSVARCSNYREESGRHSSQRCLRRPCPRCARRYYEQAILDCASAGIQLQAAELLASQRRLLARGQIHARPVAPRRATSTLPPMPLNTAAATPGAALTAEQPVSAAAAATVEFAPASPTVAHTLADGGLERVTRVQHTLTEQTLRARLAATSGAGSAASRQPTLRAAPPVKRDARRAERIPGTLPAQPERARVVLDT